MNQHGTYRRVPCQVNLPDYEQTQELSVPFFRCLDCGLGHEHLIVYGPAVDPLLYRIRDLVRESVEAAE